MRARSTERRGGYTLIELMVAVAVFVVIIGLVFTALSSYFRLRTANEQEMIIQQNFRFAAQRMTDDLRQATTGAASGDIILAPADGALGATLQFNTPGGTVAYTCQRSGTGASAIYRNGQAVTEQMSQLVNMYFVRSGGKVLVIIVGQVTYFGRARPVSFASLVFSRNSAYALP